MLKKILLSFLYLSSLSVQGLPKINPQWTYPFIGMQYALGSGYYFRKAYHHQKALELEQTEEFKNKWITGQEQLSFLITDQLYDIPVKYDSISQCKPLETIRDDLQKNLNSIQNTHQIEKNIKLVITPTLSNKILKKYIVILKENGIEFSEDLREIMRTGFAASHGNIIHLPLKEIVKLDKLSNDNDKAKYNTQLQNIYAGLGHELSHLENKDSQKKIIATALTPFITEGIWQTGSKLFRKKPSPIALSYFQFFSRAAAQLPIGITKFCATGLLIQYYKAFLEYRCDKDIIKYIGQETGCAEMLRYENKANKINHNPTQALLYHYYIVTNRLETYRKLAEDLEEAQINNDKKEIIKIKSQIHSLQTKYFFDKYIYQFTEKISKNDSAMNFLSIAFDHHPSHKYRAEYLKKVIKEEELKQSSQ